MNISLLADYAQGKQSYIGYSEIDFGVFFASQTQHVALMKVKFDVEEFKEYDSVVVFMHVARAYIAKFFVTSH